MATYAIVKTGGKQYKVAVGDVVKVEKLDTYYMKGEPKPMGYTYEGCASVA